MLKNKKVLITGGSRGIGRAIALEFAKKGARVCIVYKNSDKNARQVIEQIIEINKSNENMSQNTPIMIKCDAADPDQSAAAVQKCISEFKKIDILVNNVAVSENTPFLALSRESWQKAVEVNINSLYNFSFPALHHMKDHGSGKILNIGSLCGVRTVAAVPVHYAMTKGAMNAFTFTLAREVGRYNIQVNSLAPGLVETDFAKGLPKVRQDDFNKFCPMKRTATPEEIAKTAAFIVSDDNSYMTGETVLLTGGL